MNVFRLAHLSDPHLPPPTLPFRWADVASKRLLSRFAWLRKRHAHVKAVLDALTGDIAARAPNHVTITGDLINFTTPAEFAAAGAWLQTLGDPADVTVTPGNHDALTARGAPEGFEPWRPWLGDGDDFPRLRVRGRVALVNLSSATPTALHLAQGSLGVGQIAQAGALLSRLGEGGFYRVVLVHHPVAPGVVSRRKSLTDAQVLRAMLRQTGAELILHGHAHESLLTSVAGPRGPIPALGVPSASTPCGRAHEQAARWNEIEITGDGADFQVRISARGVTPALTVEPLGSFILA